MQVLLNSVLELVHSASREPNLSQFYIHWYEYIMNISWLAKPESGVKHLSTHHTHTHVQVYTYICIYGHASLWMCLPLLLSSLLWFYKLWLKQRLILFFFFFVVNFAPNLGLKLMAPDQELDVLLSEPARRSQNRLNSWLGSRLYENSEVDPNCNPPQIFMECQQQRWHRCSHEGLQKKHSIGSPTMSVQPS